MTANSADAFVISKKPICRESINAVDCTFLSSDFPYKQCEICRACRFFTPPVRYQGEYYFPWLLRYGQVSAGLNRSYGYKNKKPRRRRGFFSYCCGWWPQSTLCYVNSVTIRWNARTRNWRAAQQWLFISMVQLSLFCPENTVHLYSVYL